MYLAKSCLVIVASIVVASTSPLQSMPASKPASDPSYGPIPGQSDQYNTYTGLAAPFPANITSPILPTATGLPGADDILFQNLLNAEWIIYSFYQAGVQAFNSTSFTSLGLPNTTYQRITTIRDNEAGHLRIFQDSISPTSVKPGPCNYTFPFESASDYLALQLLIEVASMVFLTGLVQQTTTNATKGALTAVSEVETRHNTWALIDVWGIDPFSGPADTAYAYANQILDMTRQFIVDGSCPAVNPGYPSPSQNLPRLSFNSTVSSGHPGDAIVFDFPDPANQPVFNDGQEYWAVFFHGLANVSVPFEPGKNLSTVPEFDEGRGVVIAVIADTPGAWTEESVVAGPLILVQQPESLTGMF